MSDDREKLKSKWGAFVLWIQNNLTADVDKVLLDYYLEKFKEEAGSLTLTEAKAKVEKPDAKNPIEVFLNASIEWEAIWERENRLAEAQSKAKELREQLASGVIKGDDIRLFRSETRVIRNTKKYEKALKRIEELEARLKGEAPKPPVVPPPSKPEVFPTKEQIDLLEMMFVNQLVLRGFSEMFAKRELNVARDDLHAEIKSARELEGAKTLVREFAKSYFMLQGRRPYKEKGVTPEPILPAISGGEFIPSVREQEGYSPIDGQPLVRMRVFPLRGLVWWVKEAYDLYREDNPYTIDEHGNRVRRDIKYFLWSNQEGVHRELTLDELVQRGFAASRGIERAETNAARLYKAFLNERKDIKVIPELASEYGITEARANEIIQKGNTKGLLSLWEEVD